MDCSESSQNLHAEERDQLEAVVKSAVTSALAEALPVETDKIRHSVENVLDMLRTISKALSTADFSGQENGSCFLQNRMPQVVEAFREEPMSLNSPLNTLEHVREKLFQEIMQPKPSSSFKSLSSGEEAVRSRNLRGRFSRSASSKVSHDQLDDNLAEAPNMGASQSVAAARQQDDADAPSARATIPNIPGLVMPFALPPVLPQDQPDDDVFVVVEKDGPQLPSSREVPKGECLESVPVVPCASPHQLEPFVESAEGAGRKTAGTAIQNVQKLIISNSCAASGEVDLTYMVVPPIRLIIHRLFQFRMSVLLIVILGAAIRLILRFQYNSTIYIVRDVAALTFAIAAVLACTQLTPAQRYIDHMNCWAANHAISETWAVVSQRRQRALLAWWALTLLFVLPGEIGIVYQFSNIAHDDNTEVGFLWAAEILTCLTFILSSSMLLSAAFVQCHIISALDVFIDAWSCELCEQRDFFAGVVSWNTVQALICRAGSSFENVFAVIQTFGLLGCVALATQGIGFALHPDWSLTGLMSIAGNLPLLLLVALAGSLLLQCSCITDKCSTLAPLANQIVTEAMDKERQYLVRFLTDSAASICVKGVRLDMVLVTNVVYFVMVAVSGFFGLAIRLSDV